MALVISKRRICFSDKEGTHVALPLEGAQLFPDRFLNHPYFKSARQSGWISLVHPVDIEAPLETTESETVSSSVAPEMPQRSRRERR